MQSAPQTGCIGCIDGEEKRQSACKPGSVGRGFPRARRPFLWDGACATSRATNPDGGPETGPGVSPCRPYSVLLPAGLAVPPASPRARCALTAPFHPDPDACAPGGLLSVALSLGSPPPDVIRRRVSVEPGLSSALASGGRPADWRASVTRRDAGNQRRCGLVRNLKGRRAFRRCARPRADHHFAIAKMTPCDGRGLIMSVRGRTDESGQPRMSWRAAGRTVGPLRRIG